MRCLKKSSVLAILLLGGGYVAGGECGPGRFGGFFCRAELGECWSLIFYNR